MHDAELDELRTRVDSRAVLEKAGWQLDALESSSNAAKYRDGPGRIVIVTHDGRGWFDPLNDARGDVIALAQHLWGGNIGHARKALRPLAGITPLMQPRERPRTTKLVKAPTLWKDAKLPRRGSPGWLYLTEARAIPAASVELAISAGVLKGFMAPYRPCTGDKMMSHAVGRCEGRPIKALQLEAGKLCFSWA